MELKLVTRSCLAELKCILDRMCRVSLDSMHPVSEDAGCRRSYDATGYRAVVGTPASVRGHRRRANEDRIHCIYVSRGQQLMLN